MAPPRRPGRTRRPKPCIGPRRWKRVGTRCSGALESRPRDPPYGQDRRRLPLLRAAVARDADIFLRKKLSIVPENDHELAKIGK